MLKEFKEFAMKGNVLDLAIGVIIGGAFGAIISSMVDDIMMPIIGAIFGGLDFSNYFLGLSSAVTAGTLDAAKEQGAVLAYGSFITAAVNFLIIAFILFLVVKGVNQLKREEDEAPAPDPEPSKEEVLLGEIRDLMAKQVSS
ncbi:MAG: large conductance mechanosensitive channel protein MscL [Pseudomonadota bacterium]